MLSSYFENLDKVSDSGNFYCRFLRSASRIPFHPITKWFISSANLSISCKCLPCLISFAVLSTTLHFHMRIVMIDVG